jgi:hypothetical protein
VVDQRRPRLWGLIAERAGLEGAPVSAAHACAVAVAVGGVDGGWLSVMSDPARRALVHATDGRAAELEELQFTLGEGPGTADFRLGTPELIADLALAAGRWPGFAPAAVAAGARALFALPLQAGAIRVGVLSLYRSRPGSLTPRELADVLTFADIALQMVLDAAAGISDSPEYQLSDGRAEVYQATGMISVQLGVSLEEALVRLRARAFAEGATLSDVASEVISRKLRFDPGTERGPA